MKATSAQDAAAATRIDGWKHFALAERAASFGYWRLALADNSMFWSEGLYRLLAADPQKQVPALDCLLDHIEPRDVRIVLRRIRESIACRAPFHFRVRTRAQVVDTDGEIELGADGKVVAIVGVCTDVTAQVKAEAEREIARERYRMMAEESSDIIVLYENGRAVCASHALGRILGIEPWHLEGGHYLDVVHPDDRAEAGKLRGRPMPGEIWTATYRARHAGGHYVWIEAATRGIADANGAHREITVARDVTERKVQELKIRAAQERAEAANRAKALFLANMSHELRTPLNAIIGFAEIMRGHLFGSLGNSRYEDYATQIYNSGRYLLNQFCDILEMAQIEAGTLELNFEPFDLAETVGDCARQMQTVAEERGLSVALDVPAAGAPITADRRAARQIVLNLLSNALKFTKRGGHVRMQLQSRDGNAVLVVRDDGIGIPSGALDRLGRPFEQACSDPYLAKGGQGLGLALVRALAAKHGGRVAIASEEGKGTEVCVEFPAEPVCVAA
ncbi:MAG TPA: ATP-binding protein [Rhizomicrobium sp.]|jgi:cell cycle sensor histidine kinase DivJ|nr:ATP-binding protein [Rhizomicrobium sp.]